MSIVESVTGKLAGLKKLSPSELKKLANERLSEAVLQEVGRARTRVLDLEQRYPSAGAREKAQRLVDGKKSSAGLVGGLSGVFGLASVPAELLVMTWLQLTLLVDIATVYKVNLKSARARAELLDLFGYANGIGPLEREGPKVLGKLAGMLLEKGGLKTIGKAVPLVSAPLSAYLNNQHVQQVGEEAIRFYEGFAKSHEKTRRNRSASA